MAVISSKNLLAEINGQEFRNRGQLEKAVVEVFKKRSSEILSGYSPSQLIRWGDRHRAIIPVNGNGFRIDIDSLGSD